MISDRQQQQTRVRGKSLPKNSRLAKTHYDLLGLHPSAEAVAIRRSYRRLSKKYHPDTTELTPSVATAKFQRLNEAYAILSRPEKRSLYDLKIGYSRLNVIQAPQGWERESAKTPTSNHAYLDPNDRPLSSGEVFVLVLLGCTFVGCIVLVLGIAYIKGTIL